MGSGCGVSAGGLLGTLFSSVAIRRVAPAGGNAVRAGEQPPGCWPPPTLQTRHPHREEPVPEGQAVTLRGHRGPLNNKRSFH